MDPWALHRLHKSLRQGRRLLAIAVVASCALHATAMVVLMGVAWNARYRTTRLSDAPSERSAATELVIAEAPEAEAMPEPAPMPPPPMMPANAPPILSDEFTRREMPVASAPTVHPLGNSASPDLGGMVRPSIPSVEPAPEAPREAQVTFAGIVAPRARSVVYVVDAAAPMVSSWKWLREEMMRSVARLDESQRFQVIVTRAGRVAGAADVPSGGAKTFSVRGLTGLVPSTRENKLALAQWLLEMQPAGRSDPLPGLTEALKMRPDLVFVLTHSIRRSGPDSSWGAGKDATLATLDRLNPKSAITGQRPVVIKTIQLIEEDPTGMLKAIAEAHGDGAGSYRVMTLNELKE